MALIACNSFHLDSESSIVLKVSWNSDSRFLGILSIDEKNSQTKLGIFEFSSGIATETFKAAQLKDFVFSKECVIVCSSAGDLWALNLQKFPEKILFHAQMTNLEFLTVSINSAFNCIAVGTAQTDAIQNSDAIQSESDANTDDSVANDDSNDQICENEKSAHILFFDSVGVLLGSYGDSQADSITALEFARLPECQTILGCGCADGLLNVFDIEKISEDDALLYSFNVELGIAAIHFIPNEELLAITDNGNVTAWNFRSGDFAFSIENPISKLTPELQKFSLVDAFVYSNDSVYLVLTDNTGSMQIVNWNRAQCKFDLSASHGGNGGVTVNRESFAAEILCKNDRESRDVKMLTVRKNSLVNV